MRRAGALLLVVLLALSACGGDDGDEDDAGGTTTTGASTPAGSRSTEPPAEPQPGVPAAGTGGTGPCHRHHALVVGTDTVEVTYPAATLGSLQAPLDWRAESMVEVEDVDYCPGGAETTVVDDERLRFTG